MFAHHLYPTWRGIVKVLASNERIVEAVRSLICLIKRKVVNLVHRVPHFDLLITDEGQLALFPESILETRWVKHGSKLTEESLVKWRTWFSS